MFEGHDPYLVALSVVIAILGGYTGFGLAARIRGTPGVSRRVLLAGAAGIPPVRSWAMHFLRQPAAPVPARPRSLVLPTLVSFFSFALVVRVALVFLSLPEPAPRPFLAVIVAVLCFVIAAGFLLSLVPDPRRQTAAAAVTADPMTEAAATSPEPGAIAAPFPRLMAAPLGGLGQPPRAAPAPRLPVEGADGTHFIDTADIRSVRADAHYTRIHDGTRERMCPWSISEAEAQLDPGLFVRVHRSHIVAMAHVTFVRKEGDGAVIELDGPSPHRVPVSRAKIAEVKARLGLAKRHA